jgi:hypothetical protein
VNGVQQGVLDDLHRDGISSFGFDELFGNGLWSDMLADSRPFVLESEEKARALGEKPAGKGEVIFRRFFDRGADELPSLAVDSPWLRLVASDELLGIVNTYQGAQARLFYVDNWFTPPYPNAKKRVASQKWHRDPEDEHVVKLFVYLSDVDEEAGPFEYVRSSTTGGRYGELWRWGKDGEFYPPKGELEAAVAPEDQLLMKGSAGTVVLADTGGFHRGGFAKTKPRVLSVATYLQPPMRDGRKPRFSVTGDGDALSVDARFALGL